MPWGGGAGGGGAAWVGVTQLIGRTRGDQIVCVDGERSLKGRIVTVEITDSQLLTLFGKVV